MSLIQNDTKGGLKMINKIVKKNDNANKQNILHFNEAKFFYESVSCEEAFSGKIKTNIDDFVFQYDIDNSTSVYRDQNGKNVLRLYFSVPTFDEGDREWDSYRKLFIVPYKNGFKGLLVFGGYEIAKIYIYTNLKCADEKTKNLLIKAEVISK